MGAHFITKSLLTRENLSNIADIKADTLFHSAKTVEVNCKKALVICVAKDSPYRIFDGIFQVEQIGRIIFYGFGRRLIYWEKR